MSKVEKQKHAMESLQQISDISWYVDHHLDKLDYLYKSLEVNKRRTKQYKDKMKLERILSPRKIKIFNKMDLFPFNNQPTSQSQLANNYYQTNKYKFNRTEIIRNIKHKSQFYSNMRNFLQKDFCIDGLSMMKNNPQKKILEKSKNKVKRVFMGRPLYSSKSQRKSYSKQ